MVNVLDKKKRNRWTNGQKIIEVHYTFAFIINELLRLFISRWTN